MRVAVDQRAKPEQIVDGLRSEPLPDVSGGVATLALARLDPRQRVAHLALEDEEVVVARLDAHQQAVEGRHVGAARVEPALEPLHERRSRSGERVEDTAAGAQMPGK